MPGRSSLRAWSNMDAPTLWLLALAALFAGGPVAAGLATYYLQEPERTVKPTTIFGGVFAVAVGLGTLLGGGLLWMVFDRTLPGLHLYLTGGLLIGALSGLIGGAVAVAIARRRAAEGYPNRQLRDDYDENADRKSGGSDERPRS